MMHVQPRAESDGTDTSESRQVNWWHRDHPVFTPLSGFFSGLAFMLLVPGLFAALLESFLSQHTVTDLFPFGLLMLVAPIVLIAVPRSRRFGLFFALGMVATAVVVLGVGALALWVMTSRS